MTTVVFVIAAGVAGLAGSSALYRKYWPKLSDYAIESNILGKGSFGQVSSAQEKSTDQKVAIKFIPKEELDHSSSAASKIEALSKVSHDNIADTKFLISILSTSLVRASCSRTSFLKATFLDLIADRLPVVTEFAEFGTLEEAAKSGIVQTISFDHRSNH